MLKGCETSGYAIVCAVNVQLTNCSHWPAWRDDQLTSKSTWVGKLEGLQVRNSDEVTMSVESFNLLNYKDLRISVKLVCKSRIQHFISTFVVTLHLYPLHSTDYTLIEPH